MSTEDYLLPILEFSMPNAKNDVNKSAEIRAILEKNPKAKARDVISSLAEKGIRVSYNLVYLAKAKRGAKRRKQRRQKAVASANSAGIANPVQLILRVKGLADEAGGIRNLKQLVDVLAD
jgi:formiminotetrahydrofolate cyclodeaminase